ncbi:MAG: Mercuric transport protein MerT [Planctomycetes bacterium]|nr:Mercuric transport protein MerT [Planctomycetota bacterium]
MDTTASTGERCPTCGNKGRSVKPLTLRALLNKELVDNLGNADYRFCDAADCEVVYHGHGQIFSKSQLSVPVGVKETTGQRPLCYCFGHSVASIKAELRTKGRSDALEDIRQKMKAPGCRCETENPSGACCLGSVAKGIETAQKELGMSDAVMPTENVNFSSSRGETLAKVGTLLSAIMASSCCWLPLVLLALGVSGAGIASTLEAYRPLFMVITFSFLSAAFYFAYRPKKATVGGKHDGCATEEVEDCCSPAAKGRFGMMAMNKIMLWGVTAMAVAFLFFPSYVGSLLEGDGSAVTKGMNRSVFAIEGMTCEGCSAIAAKAIRGVSGVLAVEVSYENGLAVVGTEVGRTVPKDAVLKAIEGAGYTGSIQLTKDDK